MQSDTARAPDEAGELGFTYTNWRGETAERRVRPVSLRFGSTEWHPTPQWLLLASDASRGGEAREFALADAVSRDSESVTFHPPIATDLPDGSATILVRRLAYRTLDGRLPHRAAWTIEYQRVADGTIAVAPLFLFRP